MDIVFYLILGGIIALLHSIYTSIQDLNDLYKDVQKINDYIRKNRKD